jgi:hypothetical protein
MDAVKLLSDALELAKNRVENLPDGEVKEDIKFDIEVILQKLEYKIT